MPKIITDEEIYQAVMQVVSERGYAGATTKQIAEAANVSEVTLFRKYDNKLQLVKQAIAAIVVQTDFRAATQYTGNVVTDLMRIVQAYQDSAVKHGQLIFTMLSELPRYPELADLLDIPFEIYTEIGNLITIYHSEGILRKENPLHAVAALLGPLMFSAMLKGVIPNNDLLPMDLEGHVASFLEGRLSDHQY